MISAAAGRATPIRPSRSCPTTRTRIKTWSGKPEPPRREPTSMSRRCRRSSARVREMAKALAKAPGSHPQEGASRGRKAPRESPSLRTTRQRVARHAGGTLDGMNPRRTPAYTAQERGFGFPILPFPASRKRGGVITDIRCRRAIDPQRPLLTATLRVSTVEPILEQQVVEVAPIAELERALGAALVAADGDRK